MRLALEENPFEHLIVDAEVAEDIFFDSPHKLDQIPQIASQLSDGTVIFSLKGVSWLKQIINLQTIKSRCTELGTM